MFSQAMADFEPSPRSSKRRRTGTYATRRTTLSTATPDPTKDNEEQCQRIRTVVGETEIGNDSRDDAEEESALETELTPTTANEDLEQDSSPATPRAKPRTIRRRSIGNSRRGSGGFPTSPAKEAADGREESTEEPKNRSREEQNDEEICESMQIGGDTEIDSTEQETARETPKERDEGLGGQTRSSGRARRPPKRFAITEGTTDRGPALEKTKPQKATAQPSKPQTQSILSPQPKGILTPSRREKRTGPRKSVVFDGGEKRIEEELGFKDIDSSSTKKGKRGFKGKTGEDQERRSRDDGLEHEAREVNGVRGDTPSDGDDDDDDNGSILDTAPDVDAIPSIPTDPSVAINGETHAADILEDNEHVTRLKHEILTRLTSSSLAPIFQLEKEYTTLHNLLSATITVGESNSLLLLGSRGSGKTLLIEHALRDLSRKHASDFHIVRLNGFFQTDDKLALREIWRQLGREMAVPEDETGEVSSYADTMASLLSLLSHPGELLDDDPDAMVVDGTAHVGEGEKMAKSVIFILDEFDLFTTHPRQTLLYNLFDIAQAKKAPIAVVGCSTRTDVVDLLEKRVKSRFSHRWLHLSAMKSLPAFEEAVRGILCLPVDGGEALGVATQDLEWRVRWNGFIKTQFFSSPTVQSLVKKVFYSTKSIPDVLAALYIPIATLRLTEEGENSTLETRQGKSSWQTNQPSLLALLSQLPTLHLALLVAGTRLETIHNLTTVNFTLVHSHYSELLARSKLQRSAYSSLTSGGAFTGGGLRSWSKDTARGAWEDLASWEVIVPVSGLGGNSVAVGKFGDEGLGGEGPGIKMFRLDVTLDEVAWAIKEKLGTVGAGEVLTKWCKEV